MQIGAEAPGDAGPRPRILIVDDIFDNRAVLARRFERRGYEVVEADSGARGLELIGQDGFDLVLLDVMMPDMDGRDVLRRIREQHSAVSLPVIMVTAKSQSEDVVEALNLGANDYITKPVDFAVALARVQTQVGRKRAEARVWEANEALARANEDLERRVAHRTAELVRANDQLQEAIAEARAASRAKDEFLSNMSHELKTPLNGVIGMAQVLATTSLTQPQREMTAVIGDSAHALQRVLSEVLEMVDLMSGRVALARSAVDLGDLLRACARETSEQAASKGLAFDLELDPTADGSVETDPVRLRQVLSALLENAVKFTDHGRVGLKAVREGGEVLFEISDTGVGFDKETADRLFQRFQQADNSITRRFGGMGLGLAIARELVAQMGGAISAEGKPGEGAVFRVRAPLPALCTSEQLRVA